MMLFNKKLVFIISKTKKQRLKPLNSKMLRRAPTRVTVKVDDIEEYEEVRISTPLREEEA